VRSGKERVEKGLKGENDGEDVGEGERDEMVGNVKKDEMRGEGRKGR
jgi:hypothetical protein